MSKREIRTGNAGALKPTPTAYLTRKEGTRLVGVLNRKIASKTYPGQRSYLIAVEDTDAAIRLWDKETKTDNDVDIQVGDKVFVKGTRQLNALMDQVNEGEKVEIIYEKKGVAKPGQRAPYLFKLSVIE